MVVKARDRPVQLPHLEIDGVTVRFLGEEVSLDVFDPFLASLWDECRTGERVLGSWDMADQSRIQTWHSVGLIIAGPSFRSRDSLSPVVLSPHPDDAELALGGILTALGGHVINVFSVEIWTRRPYYRARPALSAEVLLAEERAAGKALGVDVTFVGHVDGAARPAWTGGFFVAPGGEEDAFADEPGLLEQVTDDIAAVLPATGPVIVPLAVGGHVDHLLVREAATRLITKGALDPSRVAFYEDMPYSLFGDAAATAARLSQVTALGEMHPVVVRQQRCCAEVKHEALLAYRLQVTTGIARRVIRYGMTLGSPEFAERLWAPPAGRTAAESIRADTMSDSRLGPAR